MGMTTGEASQMRPGERLWVDQGSFKKAGRSPKATLVSLSERPQDLGHLMFLIVRHDGEEDNACWYPESVDRLLREYSVSWG